MSEQRQKDSMSMTGRTTGWDAKTTRVEGQRSLTASARAARSMRAVARIADTEQRRAAFAEHMEAFPPTIARL